MAQTFTTKLVRLLLAQQQIISRQEIGLKDPHSNWNSVGEILGSTKYGNHLEEMLDHSTNDVSKNDQLLNEK